MKKVLHVIWSLSIGGAEGMLVDIVSEQSSCFQVYLVVINKEYNIDLVSKIDDRVKVYLLNRPEGSYNPYYFIRFIILQLIINANIIHAQAPYLYRLLFGKGIKCVTIHSVGRPSKDIHKYDKIFSISNSVRKDVKKISGRDSVLIYNGVRTNEIEKKENCTFGVFKIVQIGGLDISKKGQDVLLHAIKYLIDEMGVNNISVDFIGAGESMGLLTKLVGDLGIDKYVRFVGLKERAEIYSELKEYNLLVQPSRIEGFGLTIVEAMIARVPVLVSNAFGAFEVIQNGRLGYWFDSEDFVGCARGINKIINSYNLKDTSLKLDRAFDYAQKHYNIKNTAKQYMINYNNMTKV